ncbi:MAG: LPS-assembly protein LptD [Gammaproteobacteria bacterium]|nr:LPS-assembly protein LptD [Gammaproteobacteria bacterium]
MRRQLFFIAILSQSQVWAEVQCTLPEFSRTELSKLAPGEALANYVEIDRDDKIATLNGAVEIATKDWRINAELATINDSDIELEGNVIGRSEDFAFAANTAAQQSAVTTAEDVQFSISQAVPLNGSASTLTQSLASWSIQEVMWTSCELSDPTWRLEADQINIDRATNQGTAKHVTLKIGQVPVAYLPWIRFNISGERQSGFLPPNIRYFSAHGLGFSQPYYWNIAPHTDATVTPLLHTENQALDVEWRYLSKLGRTTVTGAINDSGELFRAEHRWRGEYFNLGVDWATLTEDATLSDWLTAHSLRDADFLPKNATLGYQRGQFSATLSYDEDQPLKTETQYDRLPSLTLRWTPTFRDKWSPSFTVINEDLRAPNEDEGERQVFDAVLDRQRDFWGFELRSRLRYTLNRQTWNDQSTEVSRMIRGLDLQRPIQLGEKFSITPRVHWTRNNSGGESLRKIDGDLKSLNYENFYLDNPYSGYDILPDGEYLKYGLQSKLQLGNSATLTLYGAKQNTIEEPTLSTSAFDQHADTIYGASFSPNQSLTLAYRHVENENFANVETDRVQISVKGERFKVSAAMDTGDNRNDERWASLSFALNDKLDLSYSGHWVDNTNKTTEQLVKMNYHDCCSKFGAYAKLTQNQNSDDDWQIGVNLSLSGFGDAAIDSVSIEELTE